MDRLIIIGASGHGKVVADIAVHNGYEQIEFLDDREELTECGGFPVVGKTEQFVDYDCEMIVAIGNMTVRKKLIEKIEKAGKRLVTLVHPKAVIAGDVTIGLGSVVMAGAVINPNVIVGKGCIINTCASIDHDCILNDYVHVSVGSHLAGTVSVGGNTLIGIGAVVSNNINIVDECVIGAGAVVVKNIVEKGTYIGVPAKKKG